MFAKVYYHADNGRVVCMSIHDETGRMLIHVDTPKVVDTKKIKCRHTLLNPVSINSFMKNAFYVVV